MKSVNYATAHTARDISDLGMVYVAMKLSATVRNADLVVPAAGSKTSSSATLPRIRTKRPRRHSSRRTSCQCFEICCRS